MFAHSHPFYFTDSKDVSDQSCPLLHDLIQFTLIHGPNIPGTYAIFFFIALDFTFTARHIHNCHFHFVPANLFFLVLIAISLWSSPVPFWTPDYLGCSISGVTPFWLFDTVHGVLMANILVWIVISYSSGPHFVRKLHFDSSVLGGPARHGSQLHWVNQVPSPWQNCDPWRNILK